jgi:hypothetical protein
MQFLFIICAMTEKKLTKKSYRRNMKARFRLATLIFCKGFPRDRTAIYDTAYFKQGPNLQWTVQYMTQLTPSLSEKLNEYLVCNKIVSPDWPWAPPPDCTMGTGSFPGVEMPGRGADHPPPPSAEVENE